MEPSTAVHRVFPVFNPLVKMSAREAAFVEQNKHKDLVFEPIRFVLSSGQHYTPDFFCKNDGTYIEVVGSRQAFSYARHKYELFEKEFGPLDIVYVNDDGTMKPYRLVKMRRDMVFVAGKFVNRKSGPGRDWLNAHEVARVIGSNSTIVGRVAKKKGLFVVAGKHCRYRIPHDAIEEIRALCGR